MRYERDKHMHVGYYKDGNDFEGVALKIVGKQKWDVFFNFKEYKLPLPPKLKGAKKAEFFGTCIFSSKTEKDARAKFAEWVVKELLPAVSSS